MPEFDYTKMFAEVEAELHNLHRAKANQEDLVAKTAVRIEALTKTYNAIAPLVGKQPIPTLKDTLVWKSIKMENASSTGGQTKTLR